MDTLMIFQKWIHRFH